MNGKYFLANLVSQHLQCKLARMNIDAAAMHHQPRWFINRDEVLVVVKDGEFGLHDFLTACV